MHAVIRKYADAYLNVYGDSLTLPDMKALERFGVFCKAHRGTLFFLMTTALDEVQKEKSMNCIYANCQIPDSFRAVVDMLFVQKRIQYLSDVCILVSELYKKRNAIYEFRITSSCELSSEQKKTIEQFLARNISGTIICTYGISPELIAGIRIQGDTLMWEHSINQQLRAIQCEQRV